MIDEQGYDTDLDYTAVDNPFWDGTDGAHPAWWRGNDDGCIQVSLALQKIAETGKHEGCFGGKEVEAAAQSILKLHNRIALMKSLPLVSKDRT